MFTKKQEFSQGSAIFQINSLEKSDITNALKVLRDFYADMKHSSAYTPHANEEILRQEILKSSDTLNNFASKTKELLNQGYYGIAIEKLGISGSPNRNSILYAIGLALGYPTPTDRMNAILWDVKPRVCLDEKYESTFSENAALAELHTDSSFYEKPEESLFLYVANSAKCGGGRSLILSAGEIIDQLHETADGVRAYEALCKPIFPFLTPLAFSKVKNTDSREVCIASIFGLGKSIKYRKDSIEKGFEVYKNLRTPEAEHALQKLADIIENKSRITDFWLDDDSFILINNHTCLHGRTGFSDHRRHLIRARISYTSVAKLGRGASLAND